MVLANDPRIKNGLINELDKFDSESQKERNKHAKEAIGAKWRNEGLARAAITALNGETEDNTKRRDGDEINLVVSAGSCLQDVNVSGHKMKTLMKQIMLAANKNSKIAKRSIEDSGHRERN